LIPSLALDKPCPVCSRVIHRIEAQEALRARLPNPRPRANQNRLDGIPSKSVTERQGLQLIFPLLSNALRV